MKLTSCLLSTVHTCTPACPAYSHSGLSSLQLFWPLQPTCTPAYPAYCTCPLAYADYMYSDLSSLHVLGLSSLHVIRPSHIIRTPDFPAYIHSGLSSLHALWPIQLKFTLAYSDYNMQIDALDAIFMNLYYYLLLHFLTQQLHY